MKLVIINGSPRGKESNSEVIINWIMPQLDENILVEKYYSSKTITHKAAVDAIEDNTTMLVVFPLYADAMPWVTKLFFEELDSIAYKKNNIKIYFIVHSGFEGAKHCRVVEQYLAYFAEHLGFKYMGTAIKPGSEGFRLIPEEYIKEIKNDFVELSSDITKGVSFNNIILKKLAGFEVLSEEYIERINQSNGETKYIFDILKQNNVYDKSFDKPYQRKNRD